MWEKDYSKADDFIGEGTFYTNKQIFIKRFISNFGSLDIPLQLRGRSTVIIRF